MSVFLCSPWGQRPGPVMFTSEFSALRRVPYTTLGLNQYLLGGFLSRAIQTCRPTGREPRRAGNHWSPGFRRGLHLGSEDSHWNVCANIQIFCWLVRQNSGERRCCLRIGHSERKRDGHCVRATPSVRFWSHFQGVQRQAIRSSMWGEGSVSLCRAILRTLWSSLLGLSHGLMIVTAVPAISATFWAGRSGRSRKTALVWAVLFPRSMPCAYIFHWPSLSSMKTGKVSYLSTLPSPSLIRKKGIMNIGQAINILYHAKKLEWRWIN